MAIHEWKLKQVAIQAAFKQDEWRSVCQLVLKSDDRLLIKGAMEASAKWITSTPDTHPTRPNGEPSWRLMLLVPLLATLPLESAMSVDQLISDSVGTVISALKPDARERAREAVDAVRRPQVTTRSLSQQHAVHERVECCTHHPALRPPRSSIGSGVIAGMVDPHAYYASLEGAANWTMIITADRYPTYSVCKRGLTALFAQDAWKAAIAASHVTHAFMLGGGGSPAKDYELLLSLLSNPATKDDPIRMLLVDINPYMIAQSQDGLGLFIRDLPDRGRLWIQALEDDLLQLDHPDPVRKSLLERPKGAVFVITGNTIGNLSERRFFTALSGIAKKGDLLVVGCGIMDNISVNELQSEDSSKYTDHTILSFVRPGVEYAIRQNHLRQSLDHALKHSVRAEVRPGTQGGLSDVPGSCSVVLTLKADEGDIVLLRSARYPSKNLTAFAARHGWEPICVVPSPMDKQYAQFAFRFGKVDSENGIGERQ